MQIDNIRLTLSVVGRVDSTELDSVNDDVVENDDEDVDLDEESSLLKNCNNSQGTTTRSRCFLL